MRLIDERELVARISELPDLRTMSTATIGKIIKECRTIDAEPVRHGKWLYTSDDNKKRCDQCDVIHLIAQYPHGQANFCPNCGAKMDGGAEHEDA